MKASTIAIAYALAPFLSLAHAQSTSPAAGATPHQQAVTGQMTDPPASPDSLSPAGTASPHQQSVTHSGEVAMAAPFVQKASEGGMAEVELSKLAINKSNNAQVKEFANHMVTDHTQANQKLKSLAQQKGLPVSTSLDAEHASLVRELGLKQGKAFDQAYVQQMALDHDKTIALFQKESQDKDADFAKFAGDTLPTLQEHKRMVSALQQGMH